MPKKYLITIEVGFLEELKNPNHLADEVRRMFDTADFDTINGNCLYRSGEEQINVEAVNE